MVLSFTCAFTLDVKFSLGQFFFFWVFFNLQVKLLSLQTLPFFFLTFMCWRSTGQLAGRLPEVWVLLIVCSVQFSTRLCLPFFLHPGSWVQRPNVSALEEISCSMKSSPGYSDNILFQLRVASDNFSSLWVYKYNETSLCGYSCPCRWEQEFYSPRRGGRWGDGQKSPVCSTRNRDFLLGKPGECISSCTSSKGLGP